MGPPGPAGPHGAWAHTQCAPPATTNMPSLHQLAASCLRKWGCSFCDVCIEVAVVCTLAAVCLSLADPLRCLGCCWGHCCCRWLRRTARTPRCAMEGIGMRMHTSSTVNQHCPGMERPAVYNTYLRAPHSSNENAGRMGLAVHSTNCGFISTSPRLVTVLTVTCFLRACCMQAHQDRLAIAPQGLRGHLVG